jgi:UDP-2-acetamido-2-deoxy-ribo-hexuluronate aminotransferase
MEFIDLKAQYAKYRSEIDARMEKVLSHGHFIMGPEIAELEGELARYVGVPHCITVGSGTQSLEIALRALGIGAGDEVITVPFTWISSAEVIGLVGAKPVFVDIERESFNIDLSRLERAITSRTKAILPVSLFGQMPDYDRINAIASKRAIAVIEDAAQSLGATQHGRQSCGVTLIGSTSFFPAKPLGCYGDGGALFTNDNTLAEKMRAIRTHGGLKRHNHPFIGMNGRFDTLQAAILLAKLPHFQEEVEARGRIGERYSNLLRGSCRVPEVVPGNTHVYAQYTIRVPDRDIVAADLKAHGIPTAVYYPKCLHEQPAFASSGYKWGDFPEAEKASREVLSLPMHPFLSEAEQNRVVATVHETLGRTPALTQAPAIKSPVHA